MKLLKLVMIVKDCENCIEKTLNNVLPYIDEWCILDTGSSDKTISIIQNTMKNKHGKLYQEPFVDFSTSRNRVLELAGDSCKYTLMLDDSYVLINGNMLRYILSKNTCDSFELPIIDNRNRLYYSKRILLSNKKLRYKYRVHEIVEDCKSIAIDYFTSHTYIYDERDWKSDYKTKNRLDYYLKILTEDYMKNKKDKRIIYYLANTYYEKEEYEKALEFYQKRINLTQPKDMKDDEEIYQCFFMKACVYEKLSIIKPDTYTLVYKKKSIDLYRKCMEYDNRAEPLYNISLIYYNDENYKECYKILKQAYSIEIPKRKILQVQYRTYIEEIPMLLLEVCLKLNKINEAKGICKKLEKTNLDSSRFKNAMSYIKSLDEEKQVIVQKSSCPLIVFHSGMEWDPVTMKNTSGSEIMTKNMAEEFRRRNNRVIVFVNSLKNETIISGVEYKDSEKYISFLNENYVDILIVSRFTKNLIYTEGVRKVYLWLHDILPQGDSFNTHGIKFKAVLCLSKWHKKYFCEQYKFPKEMVIVTRNGISPERFNKSVDKIKNRFIYSSDPKRGLDDAISIYQELKNSISKSSMMVLCDKSEISGKTLKLINDDKSIQLKGRVNQDRLAEEYLKSDIWLYPTKWRETYCITALEAQMSRVLCASYSIGSLPEIIGDRGILAKDSKDIIRKLKMVLNNDDVKNTLINKGKQWASKQDIVTLVDEWNKYFNL